MSVSTSTTTATPSPTIAAPVIPLPFGLTGYALAFVALLIATWLASLQVRAPSLAFNAEAISNVGTVLAPLVLIAAFIERAVEVILTPLRGDVADRKQAEIEALRKENQPTDKKEAWLTNYKLETRQYAFFLAVTLGIIASLLGFRGLANLLEAAPSVGSPLAFFDIILTGAVIGGGADGIHKPVKAFTDSMEKVSKNAKAPQPEREKT
jgi:hypothetical protein